MELNENIETFIVEDWMSNLLEEFDTLDEAEEYAEQLADGDEGILEDLYILGIDHSGNKVPVQFG